MVVRKGQKLAHPERDEQERGTALMRAIGFSVLRFSQPVRTLQTPGIPDCFYFGLAPSPGLGIVASASLWWEWKKPGAERTAVQIRIGDALEAADQPYGWGDYAALSARLIRLGYIRRVGEHGVELLRRVQ